MSLIAQSMHALQNIMKAIPALEERWNSKLHAYYAHFTKPSNLYKLLVLRLPQFEAKIEASFKHEGTVAADNFKKASEREVRKVQQIYEKQAREHEMWRGLLDERLREAKNIADCAQNVAKSSNDVSNRVATEHETVQRRLETYEGSNENCNARICALERYALNQDESSPEHKGMFVELWERQKEELASANQQIAELTGLVNSLRIQTSRIPEYVREVHRQNVQLSGMSPDDVQQCAEWQQHLWESKADPDYPRQVYATHFPNRSGHVQMMTLMEGFPAGRAQVEAHPPGQIPQEVETAQRACPSVKVEPGHVTSGAVQAQEEGPASARHPVSTGPREESLLSGQTPIPAGQTQGLADLSGRITCYVSVAWKQSGTRYKGSWFEGFFISTFLVARFTSTSSYDRESCTSYPCNGSGGVRVCWIHP